MTMLRRSAFLVAFAVCAPHVALADGVRFAPLSPEQMNPAQKDIAADLRKAPRNGDPNAPPFNVYIRSPEFGAPAVAMSDYLRWGSSLSRELTEFATLLAARQWSSGYIWHQHYPLAVKAGMNPNVAAAIAAGKRPAAMKPDEALVYDFVTQIYRDHDISDATYAAALAKYGERGITDIVGLTSYYGVTAMSLIAARTTYAAGAEPKLETLAQAFPK